MAGYGLAGLHLSLLAGGGGGNDKLAIDKGGNLPEKVENHCYRGLGLGGRVGLLWPVVPSPLTFCRVKTEFIRMWKLGGLLNKTSDQQAISIRHAPVMRGGGEG